MSEEEEEIQWLKDQVAYLAHKKRYKAWFASLMKKIGDEEE